MQCRLNRPMYLKGLLSELNLTSSANIELSTGLCNVGQIDWFALKKIPVFIW